MSVLNIYAPMLEHLNILGNITDLKGEIHNNAIIVEDSNTCFKQ